MRTDASNFAYGGVLYQVRIVGGKGVYEPLKFISKKFTDPATRWDTHTQECFAIFASVRDSKYLLRGKPFIIEMDHNNLKQLEKSDVPKLVRQHCYLRSFMIWVRHIPGKSNTADYWSRLTQYVHELCDMGSSDASEAEVAPDVWLVKEMQMGSPVDNDIWNDDVVVQQ